MLQRSKPCLAGNARKDHDMIIKRILGSFRAFFTDLVRANANGAPRLENVIRSDKV